MKSVIFYATTDGHTKQIAETMAKDWQGEVVVEPADRLPSYAGNPEVANVVIGASIRYGHYNKALMASIRQHVDWLHGIESAFYSVNLTARKPGKDDPATSRYVQKFLKKTAWMPDHIAMFAGKLCYPNYRFWDKQVIRFIMTITDGCNDGVSTIEYTNWNEVQRFAKTISGLNQHKKAS